MKWVLGIRWGAKSLVSLYISVISGIVIALQYDPATPFYSTGSLEALIPFGQFWRSLHYYSSQLFFVFLLVHLVIVLIDKRLSEAGNNDKRADKEFTKKTEPGSGNRRMVRNRMQWVLLTLSMPVAALVLFTGYILRFDSTGEAAGYIAENITRSVPFIGTWLNAFLFNVTTAGLKVVYANHVIGLGCLWGYLAWDHLRKYRVRLLDHSALAAAILIFSFIVPAPLEPPWPGSIQVLGPWFFIGLQELLKYIQPFWAGIFFPVTGMIFLCLAVLDQGRARWSLIGTIIWCVSYFILTVVGWNS
ncbi:MAG: cytochrome b N-terminal domain-containing protein [Proteobacteria bacterium]|nr:cytochrome b N-terminal domain-containing protein [Pseudomonadota bacterium]MBU1738761.1 cytochrome b N-terminal domain-containing protein [Pseudomonadota bacterium]